MLERKIGSAVVVDGRRIAGPFTMTDALQALVEALDGTYARRTYEGVTTEPPEARRGRDYTDLITELAHVSRPVRAHVDP